MNKAGCRPNLHAKSSFPGQDPRGLLGAGSRLAKLQLLLGFRSSITRFSVPTAAEHGELTLKSLLDHGTSLLILTHRWPCRNGQLHWTVMDRGKSAIGLVFADAESSVCCSI